MTMEISGDEIMDWPVDFRTMTCLRQADGETCRLPVLGGRNLTALYAQIRQHAVHVHGRDETACTITEMEGTTMEKAETRFSELTEQIVAAVVTSPKTSPDEDEVAMRKIRSLCGQIFNQGRACEMREEGAQEHPEIPGLGELLHTAWRKGTDARYATTIWTLIQDMDPEDWQEYVATVNAWLSDMGWTYAEQERD